MYIPPHIHITIQEVKKVVAEKPAYKRQQTK